MAGHYAQYFGKKQLRDNVKLLKKVHGKVDSTLTIFDFFINGNWQYVNQNIYSALERMSPEEQIEFNCDTKKIDWYTYIGNYCRGIAIWYMGEDHVTPS